MGEEKGDKATDSTTGAAPAGAPRGPAARGPVVMMFDSGIGGLGVLAATRVRLSAAEFVYVADDAGFPYGAWEEAPLVVRIVSLICELVDTFRPDVVVIACNTASTLVLPALRAALKVPVVGTVPAIKPAAEHTRSGYVSVLATPGTVKRDYTRALIEKFAAHVWVRLVGSDRLAEMAEAYVRGGEVDEKAVAEEIRPAFLEHNGKRTDVVVLACTHYPFLMPVFDRVVPWPVEFVDPAEAIARRVEQVLGEALGPRAARAAIPTAAPPPGVAIFTSGRRPEPDLERLLVSHGLKWARIG